MKIPFVSLLARSKKRRTVLLITMLCLMLSAALILHLYLTERIRFSQYEALYCEMALSTDSLSLHYALSNPKAYGIDASSATLGHFPTNSAKEAAVALENERFLLSTFSSDLLSAAQALSLQLLLWQNQRETALSRFPQFFSPLSSTLGVQAQLPILFSEYAFRCREDIDTYFLLLKDTPRYFEEYFSLLQKNAACGFTPADASVKTVSAQIQDFLKNRSNSHFLQQTFENRCRSCVFLSAKDSASLSKEHFSLLTDYVFTAYENLLAHLQTLPVTSVCRGLSSYTDGKDYYEAYVQYLCGTDLSLSAIRDRLYKQLLSDMKAVKHLQTDKSSTDAFWHTANEQQMLSALQAMTYRFFPTGPEITWQLKNVDPSLAGFSSPAFYMVPPIDNISENTLYINPLDALSGLSLYTTLAHEGFPGHLYQNTYYYAKNPSLLRRLLSFGGYTEGWATYTESVLCEYEGKRFPEAKAYWLDRSLNLCIASLLDLGIHGDSWTLDKCLSFLADFGISDFTAAGALYQYIVENPGNYLQYYLGALSFLDLRAECQHAMGKDFSLKDFHKAVLDAGPCPFPLLRKELHRRLDLAAIK